MGERQIRHISLAYTYTKSTTGESQWRLYAADRQNRKWSHQRDLRVLQERKPLQGLRRRAILMNLMSPSPPPGLCRITLIRVREEQLYLSVVHVHA